MDKLFIYEPDEMMKIMSITKAITGAKKLETDYE